MERGNEEEERTGEKPGDWPSNFWNPEYVILYTNGTCHKFI